MADSHTDGKPHREMIDRQRVMIQEVEAAMSLLATVIVEIEEEGIRLNARAAEFEQAELRGEAPDPQEVAKVVTAQAALVQRCDKLHVRMRTMGEQAEAVTGAADAVTFEALHRQFNAQFNTTEGP